MAHAYIVANNRGNGFTLSDAKQAAMYEKNDTLAPNFLSRQ